MRQDQPEEKRTSVVVNHDRANDCQVESVLEQQIDHREAQDAQCDTDGCQPGVVRPDQRCEVRRRELAVVVLEVGVDKLVNLRWGHKRGLELRVRKEPPSDDQRHRDVNRSGEDPPPPGPVQGCGKGIGEEGPQVRPCHRPRSGGTRSSSRKQRGQISHQGRVRSR